MTTRLFAPTICSVYPSKPRFTGASIGNVPGRNDEISELLRAWGDGDREAAERFMPLIYDELRRQARRHLNRERANHTLQTTALVHEAFIRLNEQHGVKWQNRTHFLALAAQMMRRILVNHAVAQKREKRGGAAGTVQLEETLRIAVAEGDIDLPALDEALTRLEKLDARQSRIVEFRFFSGLSIEETAEVLSVSPATVKREWSMAKAWLRRELTGDPE